jgi:hypothetical protein
MKELFRLLYLVVVILPLTILLIGPFLVLAALRGRQRMGPIVLNPSRGGVTGRIGALLLGLLFWLLVWSGLAAVLSGVILPAIGNSPFADLQANVTPTTPPIIPTASPTPLPSPTPQPIATSTPVAPPREETLTSTSSPVPTPSSAPSPLPPTATPVTPTSTPLPTATSRPLPTNTLAPSPTPLVTLSAGEVSEAITTVEAANDLLRTAVAEPSIGNLAALEAFWQEEALAEAQAFAQDLSQRYVHPLEVTFVYLASPQVLAGNSPDTAYVISTEAWTYTGARSVHGESFEFTYTLRREGEGWVITDYAYGYAPITLPSGEGEGLTPIPVPSTITTTVAITPTDQ